MSTEDERLKRMYGQAPSNSDMLARRLNDRKYFDSGDYALSKAGHGWSAVGSKHPSPDSIPRAARHGQ